MQLSCLRHNIFLSFLYKPESLHTCVFTPQIQPALARHTVSADIVGSSVEHSFTHVSVKIRVIVVHYPLSAGYCFGVVHGSSVGFFKPSGVAVFSQ